MKKILSKVFAGLGALVIAFSLAACGVSAKTAEKINEAAKAKEYMTWTEVVEELGTDYTGLSIGDADTVTGAVVWYKGYKTYDEAKAAVDAGKTVKMITVTFFLGDAQKAEYSEWTAEEK